MISVVPLDVGLHYAKYGLVAILPVQLPISMAQLGIITRKKKEPSPAVKVFLGALRDSIRERQDALTRRTDYFGKRKVTISRTPQSCGPLSGLSAQ